ncbi:ABC transporter substrate-binding protein [Pusillimonas sp. NJUB218]|uniref:ABC transporter substrate-binding protein n=1 Tax=Pusillimonas sp. NJUB218 TaxID=2023230 RepID=UPI000F4D1C6E|nr:ABC transporter substrate-binding protein [Pusillimonas sp. NJUB218]ROT43914.1 hypothetical protein CHR62_15155 [Pusillimonas sp. NJUB218]
MIRRYIKSVVALLIASASGLAVTAQVQAKEFRVGISSPESQNPFHVVMARSIAETLKARGIEPMLMAANADVNQQINSIGDMVAAKVDAILVAPLNAEGPAAALVKAKDAGIPVFMYARTLDPKYADVWESFNGMDAVQVGRDKARWMAENTKPGKVAMLTGMAGAAPMIEQETGFREVITAAGYQIAFSQTSNMTREYGIKLTEDALVTNPDLVGIYAANDDLALGAAQAVKVAGLQGKVVVIGLNGAPSALAAIHNGDLTATVLLDPVGWGKTAANVVADYLLEGKKPAKFTPMDHKVVTQKEAYDNIPPPLREKLGVKR